MKIFWQKEDIFINIFFLFFCGVNNVSLSVVALTVNFLKICPAKRGKQQKKIKDAIFGLRGWNSGIKHN